MPVQDATQASNPSTLQFGVERRQHAGGVGGARLGIAVGPPPDGILPFEKTGADTVGAGDVQEHAVAVEYLADQIECVGELHGVVANDGHAPRHLGKAKLLNEARGEGRIDEIGGEETVILCRQQAGLVHQPSRQQAGFVEQHEPHVVGHEFGVGSVADRAANAASRDIRPAGHRETSRSDDRRLRLIIMRPDEAHLSVALRIVAHGRDRKIDAVFGEQRNAGRGVHPKKLGFDTEPFRDGARDIDLVALPHLIFVRGEERIVIPHADADAPGTKDAHEAIDTRLRAGAGHGGARLLEQPGQGFVGRAVLLRRGLLS